MQHGLSWRRSARDLRKRFVVSRPLASRLEVPRRPVSRTPSVLNASTAPASPACRRPMTNASATSPSRHVRWPCRPRARTSSATVEAHLPRTAEAQGREKTVAPALSTVTSPAARRFVTRTRATRRISTALVSVTPETKQSQMLSNTATPRCSMRSCFGASVATLVLPCPVRSRDVLLDEHSPQRALSDGQRRASARRRAHR
jgi:hypothetical protein